MEEEDEEEKKRKMKMRKKRRRNNRRRRRVQRHGGSWLDFCSKIFQDAQGPPEPRSSRLNWVIG